MNELKVKLVLLSLIKVKMIFEQFLIKVIIIIIIKPYQTTNGSFDR